MVSRKHRPQTADLENANLGRRKQRLGKRTGTNNVGHVVPGVVVRLLCYIMFGRVKGHT